MKKFGILIMMLFVLGVVNTTTLKAQDVEELVTVDTVYQDSMFVANPHLYIHAYSNPWAKTKLLQLDYQAFDNIWEYQRKQTKQMVWGLGVGSLGIAGMVYAVNMPTPVRQVNNPALDDEADKARRDRRIVGVSSIVVGAVGAYIFADSFKWTRRLKAEVGLQSLRLQYNLTGNRKYYNKVGKHPKKLKSTKYHRKHGYNN